MLSAVAITMVVESLTLALGEPPPETLTWFTCGEVAAPPTLTVTVMTGYVPPLARASLRVQVGDTVQFQPVPAIETRLRPPGIVSVTVTAPPVAPDPVFPTVTV